MLRRWPLLLAVLILVPGAFALGLRLGAPRYPQEGSAAVIFARDMRLHHGQAVDLSLHLLERPVSAPLRLLASDILVTQEAQLGQMGGWLDVWGLPFSGREPPMQGMNRAAMGMASDADIRSLDTLPPPQAEVKYLQLMIRHHRGGVQMAQGGLTSGVGPVETVARAIVTSQTAEITLMKDMLRQRGAAVPSGLPGTAAPEPAEPMPGMQMNH